MPISKLPARLVVDANPILSALIGGRARDLLVAPVDTLFFTTEQTLAEVREYLPRLAARHNLDPQLLSATLVTIPLEVRARGSYAGKIAEASRRLAQRDPEDVDLLALALELGAPVWTNDRDFAGIGVEVWTTAELLALLD